MRHGFLPIYADLFGDPYRLRALMEIGVFRGSSLMMWRDYFPEAQVPSEIYRTAVAAAAGCH